MKARRRGETVAPAASSETEVLATSAGDDGALVKSVERALDEAGKDGWRAQQAIQLARKLSTPGEAGSAALSKELDRLMGELMADVRSEPDELDQLTENVVPMRRRRSG